MSQILSATELEDSIDWITKIARGANVSKHTNLEISNMLVERDKLLSRKINESELEYENEEIEDFWNSVKAG
jgi:predicted transcriptional regulator